jgi:MYXO-CTERM domain-containing protein
MAVLTVVGAVAADAATIHATPSASTIGVGGSFSIDLFLELDVGEEASVLEARFDFVGLGSSVDLDSFEAGGPTWSLSSENVSGSTGTISNLSGNAGGSRLVATFTGTALALGDFSIEFAADYILQRDIDDFPFLEDVNLETAVGTVLATVSVVPEPSTWLFAAAGLALVAARRRA